MTATLLRDINDYGPDPSQLASFAGWTYFRMLEPSGAYALERTDGNSPPQVVEQFGGQSVIALPPLPNGFVPFQGSVYQLVGDGTTQQMRMEKLDPNTGVVTTAIPLYPELGIGLYADHLTAVNDQRMIFTDFDLSTSATTLYGTDGTDGGTVLLADSLDSNVQFVRLGSSIVFKRSGPAYQGTLWITDGTTAGTRELVSDPGVIAFAADGAKILYSHQQTTTESNLYVASVDATGATQILARNVFVNMISGSDDGTAYFTNSTAPQPTDLYVTDGTAAGTHYVDSIPWDEAPNLLVRAVAGGKAYMTADDSSTSKLAAVWVSDGTAAGTYRVTPDDTTQIGEAPVVYSPIYYPGRSAIIASVGDRVFFAVTTPSLGSELWTSDGTLAGTHVVTDLLPGPDGSNPLYLTPTPDGVLFSAHTADHHAGIFLAAPDGSGITTIVRFDDGQTASSLPLLPVTVASKTLFAASSRADRVETWVTDGTTAGTFNLSSLVSGFASVYNTPIGTVDDKALLRSLSSNPVHDTAYTYWESDGTPEGTVQLSGIPTNAVLLQGLKPYDPSQSVVVGTQTFSIAQHDDGSETLQVAEGLGYPTPVKFFPNAPRDQFPIDGVAFGGKYFYLIPAGPDRGLYVSDGTVAGTVAVAAPTASTLSGLAVVGNQLTFIIHRDPGDIRMPPGLSGGDYLMASNGTSQGTYMPSRLGSYSLGYYDNDYAVAKLSSGQFLVFADDGLHGTEPMLVIPDVPPPPYLPTPAADLSTTAVAVLTAKSATVVIPPTPPATPPVASAASVSAESPTTTVQCVEPVIQGRQIRSFSVRVSGPLDSASANEATSYRVVRLVSGRHGTFRRQVVPIRSASYDSTRRSVAGSLSARSS